MEEPALELSARGSTRSGLKAALQRRLHGLLIEAAITQRNAAREEEGMDAGWVDDGL